MATRQSKLTDDAFVRRSEVNDWHAFEEFFELTASELRGAITELIEHREELRDAAVRELEREAARTIKKLHALDRRKLLEELRCFKDILALHRRSLENDQRD